jgi:putative DNA primase/helicase
MNVVQSIVCPADLNAVPLNPAEVPFGVSQIEAKIAELAKLKPLDYEVAREAEAKALGVRVSVLDKQVEAQRPKAPENDAQDPFEAVTPWVEPVSGAALLADIHAAILRFCVLPDHSAPLMAVWVLHAWAHEAADISPVLAFVSPEKRCGKTTALSIIGALVPKAMHNVNITTSVLFRVIEIHAPTVLIDEADTYLGDNDELRGILNGGHNRLSAYVWRSVGDDHEPRRFNVWAPKCIAMIGKLPDTLEDRALVVPLRRKQSGETVERFRADRVNEFLPLRRKAARWAADSVLRLANLDPVVPSELNDRAQDNARAICAIADLAGSKWPGLIRASLVGLAAQPDDEPQSAGVLLLRDAADIFQSRRGERFGSSEVVEALCALEESPWAEWRGGRRISARGIAKLLKPFGVSPAQDKLGSFYRPSDFADAFGRYLLNTPQITATSASSATTLANLHEKPNEINDCGTYGSSGAYSDSGSCNYHQTTKSTAYEGEI